MNPVQTLNINKISIEKAENVPQEHFDKAIKAKKFIDYVNNFQINHVEVDKITILSIFMFGPNVGFINLNVDAKLKEAQKKIPGYVFLRGKAVAVLTIVNKTKILLVRQFRVPVGQFCLECPAGMMDEEGHFLGVAAKEIEEETGLKIEEKDLISLGSIFPSQGGCDEEIILFALQTELSPEKIEEMQKKTYGEGEHEDITLILQDFTYENILNSKDSKLISAAYSYNQYLQKQQNQKL
ncbi:NUDIX hydrolase domain protein [Pseudocohnilembus persalinus]|uniref:NUDIX hydrolase domain protein n=1 Tax=Pseudocohnilembus persalinus TaxID=266149 RepID=A0A0V0QID0_PSEPJ|nr:NUDIX hydrolase domain protein [Pseudocohnilembus persalinus]|eukprot:KRX02067.1 NUDIX hydrolase domain protein [Pseudocohnilembus persalinus]